MTLRDILNGGAQAPELPRTKRSDIAAQAAQVVHDLELEVEDLRKQRMSWEREALLAQGERDQLRVELDATREQMESYKSACTGAEAQFQLLGKAVLDAMQQLRPNNPQYQYSQEASRLRQANRAVEQELIPGEPVPSFLRKEEPSN